MSGLDHHWVTLHRVRFSEPVGAMERKFGAPVGPECWRFAPSQVLGENDLPTWKSEVWCGMGIYENRAAAEAMVADPFGFMPVFEDADETWHALAVPVQHRGEVNWRGVVESNSALRPSDQDPKGALAVLTTASFNSRAPSELPRISRFAIKVEQAVTFLAAQPGNLRRDVFNGGFDDREGFTLTLWESDQAMLNAAYSSGHHRKLMDESRDGSTFDRSSFTRLRIVDSHGSWNGNPLQDSA